MQRFFIFISKCVFFFFSAIPFLYAVDKHASALPPLFFDAEKTKFDRFGNQQHFEGNVVAMIGGNLICADALSLDREKNLFVAKGHVLVVNHQQVLGGDEITFQIKTEDFTMKNAFVITEDQKRADDIAHKILGLTPEEVAFDLDKNHQLEFVKEKKEKLKHDYKHLVDPSQKPFMVDEYTVLLEKEDLISKQKNTVLAQLGSHKREAIEKRRAFWEESKKDQLPIGKPLLTKTYTRIEGAWIERKDGNHYRAEDLTLTPCYCEDDEKAAWQIRAQTMDAYGEGYADLHDAIVEIKGIPVLYLPYLRLPMKGQRQSGFLFPNLSYSRFNGSIYSQSVFFDLGENKDSTFTVDFLEKRGFRLGNEFRYQEKTYSGWELQVEGIRDRQWLSLQNDRRMIARSYSDGLASSVAAQNSTAEPNSLYTGFSSSVLNSPEYWNNKDVGFSYCLQNPTDPQCEQVLRSSILAPENSFRYKSEWKGMNFITPRVSFVSSGKYLSDHRYSQDLYYEQYNETYNPANPNLFTKMKGLVHLDGNDVYAGVGTDWGDQLTSDSQLSGHQTPLYTRLRTRMFKLTEKPIPFYGSLFLNYKKITYIEDASFRNYFPSETMNPRLDSGHWTQAKFNALAPLVSDQVFALNYFTELEGRFIDTHYRTNRTLISHQDIDQKMEAESSIKTVRYGLDFQLPIDGIMQLSPSTSSKSEGLKFLKHSMNLGLTYSVRPSVVRKGPYGQVVDTYTYRNPLFEPSSASHLTYFNSDSPDNFDSDFLPEQERMIPHNQLSFTMNHDWSTYKKIWTHEAEKKKSEPKPLSFHDRARNELEYAQFLEDTLNNTLSDLELEKKNFKISESERDTFAHFDANMAYDFRKAQIWKNSGQDTVAAPLRYPWSPVRSNAKLNLYDWNLSSFTKYDMYSKLFTEWTLSLSTPTVLKTKFGLGLSIEKENSVVNAGTFDRTLTRTYGMSTNLVPDVYLTGDYGIRTKENQIPSQMYYASVGLQYASPVKCWGLQFYWRRDYPDIGWSGTYYLSVIIKFFNYNREYGNFLSKANHPQSS